MSESILKNKEIVIDTKAIDDDGLRELEFVLSNHCIDYEIKV
jgi:hypothetical protein